MDRKFLISKKGVLLIPSSLGYGSTRGPIPGGSVLVLILN
jgi:FKBP-type peptidyl-prolyl cis-trans isomerase